MIDFAHMTNQEYATFLRTAQSKAIKRVQAYYGSLPDESIDSLQKRLQAMQGRVSTLFGLDYYATMAEIQILKERIKSRK